MTFAVEVCTLRFQAIDTIYFPAPSAGNVLRGALGDWLRHAPNLEPYRYWFAPQANSGPSGFADSARPFVLRAQSLDYRRVQPAEEFCFDVHIFPAGDEGPDMFARMFKFAEVHGLGAGRGRAKFVELGRRTERVELLQPVAAREASIEFLTPTELKHQGAIVSTPEFGVLFGRIRDRVARLLQLYGAGTPPDFDFRAMGERAARIRMTRCDVAWQDAERRSSRTAQVHPLDGFCGSAQYSGALSEFIPWLYAAQLCGVGRQTVWGKGAIRAAILIR
ncbi:MAG: CRISPR system precrRNA processing endoribonuclease RAMP protein Cas6 [Bryobacterales bacterium]|nr:CRISPR system precrRNA processing endoribonuclease RAMP protein Cas6 [Bryobacterales bacterium]